MHTHNHIHNHVRHHHQCIIPPSATEETVVELGQDHNEKPQSSSSLSNMTRKDPKHTVAPPPLITKDLISSSAASYIWNDQVYHVKDPEYYFNGPLKSGFSRRGACNLCTIAFVATVILFMFAYPLSMFFLKQNTK
jgi:hypothetical protein